MCCQTQIGEAMVVYKCDLCGQVKECLQKEIDHKEYDICRECWNELHAKLQGKGRVKDTKDIVLLPPPREPDGARRKAGAWRATHNSGLFLTGPN
jgi:hypothetical protein